MRETTLEPGIPRGYCVALTQIGRAGATSLQIATDQTICFQRSEIEISRLQNFSTRDRVRVRANLVVAA
jgi:hypothetical protein